MENFSSPQTAFHQITNITNNTNKAWKSANRTKSWSKQEWQDYKRYKIWNNITLFLNNHWQTRQTQQTKKNSI